MKARWVDKAWRVGKGQCAYSFFEIYKREILAYSERGTLQTRYPLWSTVGRGGGGGFLYPPTGVALNSSVDLSHGNFSQYTMNRSNGEAYQMKIH